MKVVLVGAGSAAFSLEVLSDLAPRGFSQGLRLVLVDPDTTRLGHTVALAQRLVDSRAYDATLSTADSLDEALPQADVVINTALVGGHTLLRAGWAVARELGYEHAGSLHVMHDEAFWVDLHQLDLFASLAESMTRWCPDALLVNVSNPMFAGLTMVMRRYRQLKFVGLCDGPFAATRLARSLLRADGVKPSAPGVNHFVWLNELPGPDGRDLRYELESAIAERVPDEADAFDDASRAKQRLLAWFDRLPLGDTGSSLGGAWPWWIYGDSASLGGPPPEQTWSEYFDWLEQNLKSVAELASNPTAEAVTSLVPEERLGIGALVEAYLGGPPSVVVANVPNRDGAVPGLPEDIVVELPVRVAAGRLTPEPVQTPTPRIRAWTLRDIVAPAELLLAAWETGDRRALVDLVLTDPGTKSFAQAEELVHRILDMPSNHRLRERFA